MSFKDKNTFRAGAFATAPRRGSLPSLENELAADLLLALHSAAHHRECGQRRHGDSVLDVIRQRGEGAGDMDRSRLKNPG